jgi:hypothetical protein
MSTYKYIIVGAGFSGLAAVRTLLERGVSSNEILLIEKSDFPNQVTVSPNFEFNPVEVARIERQYRGLGKSGNSLLKSQTFQNPGFSWGLSCYKPTQELLNEWSVDKVKFERIFQDCLEDFKVQDNSKSTDTTRKVLSHILITKNSKFEHSQLALQSIGENSCQLDGGCFRFCSNFAPITPSYFYNKLVQDFGRINLLSGGLERLNIDDAYITVNNINIHYEKLLLAIGSLNYSKILGSFLDKNVVIKSSPVVLLPYLSKRSTTVSDFSKHFSYADLILKNTVKGKIDYLAQIYLPNIEITGRVLASLPKVFTYIYRFLPARITWFIVSRIGIAMIFLKDEEMNYSVNDLKSDFEKFKASLYQDLIRGGLIPFRLFSKYLTSGLSQHFGAIATSGDESKGFQSFLWKELKKRNIYILDTSILPSIQPGPHTLISVALSRYLIDEFLD